MSHSSDLVQLVVVGQTVGAPDLHVRLDGNIVSGAGSLQRALAREQQRLVQAGATWEDAFRELREMQVAVVHPQRDKKGRRVLILGACNLLLAFTRAEANFDASLLFTLFLLQALASEHFVIVHGHGRLKTLSSRYLAWVSKLYKLLPSASLKSVSRIYVLTASRQLRARMWLARPFTSARIWTRVEFVHSLRKLAERTGCEITMSEAADAPSPGTSPSGQPVAASVGTSALFDGVDLLSGGDAELDERDAGGSDHGLLVARQAAGTRRRRMSLSNRNLRGLNAGLTGSPALGGGIDVCPEALATAASRSSFHAASARASPGGACDGTNAAAVQLDSDSAKAALPSVFGAPLSTACQGQVVPQVVHDCISFLLRHGQNQEGLFRVPGDLEGVQRVKADYDAGRGGLAADLDVHVAGSLLKAYFRDLPAPIVPHDLYLSTIQLSDSERELSTLAYGLGDRMLGMPRQSFNTLGFLVHFLAHLAARCGAETRMTAQSLTLVWAPNILFNSEAGSGATEGPQAAMQNLAELPRAIRAFTCMITHAAIVFPPEMLDISLEAAGLQPVVGSDDAGSEVEPS